MEQHTGSAPTAAPVDPTQGRPRRAVGWVVAAVALLLGALAAFAVAWGAAVGVAMSTLPTYGEHTTAVVTSLSREHYTEPRYDPCGPSYTFVVLGTTYSATSPNVDEAYCTFEPGGAIDITYDAADPQQSAPAAHYTSSTTAVAVLAGSGAVLVVGALVCSVVAWRRRPGRRATV
ncbi:DUF3592 domain-containing protein [Cellulomonas sp. HZM]|uniref:DUF3592 domain-containing protein n=1 Tax=Cellulomonas sp. HZM TaxID=1454010 RepID=UPI0004938D7B|nr:DUF3592 domain-containing protein [Cellulomonas sp. HZM]